MQFLESSLIRLAKDARRMPLDNCNQPSKPSLSEADEADMQVFLDNMLGMLPVLGIHAFEKVEKAEAGEDITVLTCAGKGRNNFV